VNQRQLIDALAAQSGESKATVARVLTALGEAVHEAIATGDEVSLPQIGKIITSWRGPRVLRQIQNGRKMRIGGRYVPQLRPSSRLKQTAADRTDQSWRDPDHQRAWRLAETLIGDLELYHQERLPSLDSEQGPDAVHADCTKALGEAWRRARATYEQDIPAAVRDENDYLADAALDHWSN